MLEGDNVQDENSSSGFFSELGSSPATVEAGKSWMPMAPNLAIQGDRQMASKTNYFVHPLVTRDSPHDN